MMTKKFYLYDRLFVSNRNFTTKQIKFVRNSRFLLVFCLKFQVFPGFNKKSQVSGKGQP